MTDSNLIELAKLGDPQAIAALMNQSLESRGMRATVDRQGDCLEVILEAERVPNRQSLTAFVQKGINNLDIQSIASIRILGQQFGASYPAWMQELQLDASPNAKTETASLPIQSETAIDSSRIPPNNLSGKSGIDDFSVTNAMGASSLMGSEQPTDAADLEEEWSPASEPNFLQELLATDVTTVQEIPNDLSVDPNSDEEGLIDFLNDLSGAPASEEFPPETVQEQSSFLSSSENGEVSTLYDLFADSTESPIEPEESAWENASEPIATGEPDADLIDFLNSPEETPEAPTEETGSLLDDRSETSAIHLDEQILSEYPDAASIDQLPLDPQVESEELEAPLQEPSGEFLSNLLGEPIEPATESQSDFPAEPQSTLIELSPIQDPWTVEEPMAPSPSFDQSEFPAEPLADFSTLSATPDSEDSDMEEALPDFLVEPMLDLPESDPAEMTLIELEQQPEVLEASVDETSLDYSLNEELPTEELPGDSALEPEAVSEPTDGVPLPPELEAFESTDLTVSDPLPLTMPSIAAPAAEPPVSDESFEPPLVEEPAIELPSDEVPSVTAASDQTFAEVPPVPDATFLSNFADREASSETEDWEDVEEIPPDFLQEMQQDWSPWEVEPSSPIVTSEIVTSEIVASEAVITSDIPDLSAELSSEVPTELEQPPVPVVPDQDEQEPIDPEWADLEAKLANLDLDAEDTQPSLEDDTEVPELALEQPNTELAEMLSATPEGTAIEPPADWVAAASPTNVWAEPIAEVVPPAESDVDRSDSAAAATNGSGDATQTEPLPDLSQDELEAGLGDFRAGFVEPLPPEFFEEDDEAQSGYSDWQADLREPLSLDDNDETGYIIEDSTPEAEYTPPPLPLDPSDRETQMAPQPSSNLFVVILFALCAFLGMLGGYVLFKSRLSPNPSNVPPSTEPPASETPAPASPTSANPASPIASQPAEVVSQAIDQAFTAILMGPIAQSEQDWQAIDRQWQQAIELTQRIPEEIS